MITLRVQCDECSCHFDIALSADSAGSITGGVFDAGDAVLPGVDMAASNGKAYVELDVTEMLPEGWHVEERGVYPPAIIIRCVEHAR